MRSGTEKRCSHNLQSGHPAWWSADNCRFFSHSKYFEELEANLQQKSEMIKKLKKNNIVHLCFLAYRICLSALKLRGKLKCNYVRS